MDPHYIYLAAEQYALRHACMLCGFVGFEPHVLREVCPVCGWQDNGDPDDPIVFLDSRNRRSFSRARALFARHLQKDDDYVCDPEAYERYLARYDGRNPLPSALWIHKGHR